MRNTYPNNSVANPDVTRQQLPDCCRRLADGKWDDSRVEHLEEDFVCAIRLDLSLEQLLLIDQQSCLEPHGFELQVNRVQARLNLVENGKFSVRSAASRSYWCAVHSAEKLQRRDQSVSEYSAPKTHKHSTYFVGRTFVQ